MKQQAAVAEQDISIAMIEPVGGHGGAHYYDFGLARGLLAAGCRVSLYTCDETADSADSRAWVLSFLSRYLWMRKSLDTNDPLY